MNSSGTNNVLFSGTVLANNLFDKKITLLSGLISQICKGGILAAIIKTATKSEVFISVIPETVVGSCRIHQTLR